MENIKAKSINFLRKIDIYDIFLTWLYLNVILRIIDIYINPFISTIIKYGVLACLFIIVLIKQNFKVPKIPMIFFSVYLLLVIINTILVDYPGYVFAEGITNFLIFVNPVYIISIPNFKFDILFEKWHKIAKVTFVLVFVFIILSKIRVVSYDVFAPFLLPNVIIIAYMYFIGKYNKKTDLIILITILIVLLLFGGRMAAASSIAIVIFNMLLVKKRKLKNQIILILLLFIIVLILILNAKLIIGGVLKVSSMIGINSRTISLLNSQLEKGSLFENIYLSNRDKVYNISKEYITENWWRPNGLAVIRDLTNGEYYHPHNIVFQLLLTFGTIGTIIIVVSLIYNIIRLKNNDKENIYKFCLMLLVFYIIRSLTDTSVFVDFASIISLSILYFRQNRTDTYYMEGEHYE